MGLIGQIGQWFDQRLQLAAPIREVAEHPVPRNTASWFYVFGSAALTVFILQLVTGILLALIYVPSASEAWSSLQALNHDVTLGWFIRAMHGWGSNFMVAIVLIHMVQVFLFGAHKFPRELTWIIGVFLLLMTLGMAFTGQVLRFDQDAYWGLGIGASIASRVPDCGPNDREIDAGWTDHCRSDTVAIFRAACLRHSRNADRIRVSSSLDGGEARYQRMADAGSSGQARNVRKRISPTNKEEMARRLFPTRYGKTCFLPLLSSWRWPPALFTSVRSVQRAAQTPRSSRPLRNQTTSSCGSTACSPTCRHRWRRRRS